MNSRPMCPKEIRPSRRRDSAHATAYTIKINTEGPIGFINATWVTNTATTAPSFTSPGSPASITNLHNTTYLPTSITWNWTDPSSEGYTNARVFLNDEFQIDVPKGNQTFTKTGPTPLPHTPSN